jgi:hypothetical protein
VTAALYVAGGLYLFVGVMIATALQVLDSGTSGRSVNPLTWIATVIVWLPWLIYKAVTLALVILLPPRLTRRL